MLILNITTSFSYVNTSLYLTFTMIVAILLNLVNVFTNSHCYIDWSRIVRWLFDCCWQIDTNTDACCLRVGYSCRPKVVLRATFRKDYNKCDHYDHLQVSSSDDS